MANEELLSRRELEIINKRTLKYPLNYAEKDYLLAVVSKLISGSVLGKKLVFKGGTAIHHCYLPQTRFSEDLDFTSLDNAINIADVKAVLETQDYLVVAEEYVSKATIKIKRLKYNGPLGQPNSLKVEIDFIQNVVLPAKQVEYRNAWGVKAKVNAMDPQEICAEKIRAASGRARYRDFYDLYLMLKKYGYAIEELIELLKKKEIREDISNKSIMDNWQVARQASSKDADMVFYSISIPDEEIEATLKGIKVDVVKKQLQVKENI
jgi:predicted nucleotidyltransferase component of viral defense system